MNPHDPWTRRLSEYLDGDLSPAEHAECDAHLASCAECGLTLAELRAVAARAGSLSGTAPERDLWAGIESRLSTPVVEIGSRAQAPRTPRAWRWNLGLGQLAAAAAVLVAVTATVVWLAVGRGPSNGSLVARHVPPVSHEAGPTGTAPTETVAPAPPSSGAAMPAPDGQMANHDPDRGTPTAAADFGTARYDVAIAELESALQSQRGRLDPKTVQVVERNLATIDKAIAEARSALAADPANRYLNAHLASSMRRKVDLLRRVNALARI